MLFRQGNAKRLAQLQKATAEARQKAQEAGKRSRVDFEAAKGDDHSDRLRPDPNDADVGRAGHHGEHGGNRSRQGGRDRDRGKDRNKNRAPGDRGERHVSRSRN